MKYSWVQRKLGTFLYDAKGLGKGNAMWTESSACDVQIFKKIREETRGGNKKWGQKRKWRRRNKTREEKRREAYQSKRDWKGTDRKGDTNMGKGRRQGGERGCLSSGQVQLTLNCLALELEHLNVPEGPEEWSIEDGVPPLSHQRFALFSSLFL